MGGGIDLYICGIERERKRGRGGEGCFKCYPTE